MSAAAPVAAPPGRAERPVGVIVDGKGAVTFLVRVKEALEDPRRLLMDL